MNYYIGIDLGTSACKGILTNREGTVLAEHSVSYPISTPYTNWSEQDPADWYNAAVEILSTLSAGREAEIKGVGIANLIIGMANSFNPAFYGVPIGWINLLCAALCMYAYGRLRGKLDGMEKDRSLME